MSTTINNPPPKPVDTSAGVTNETTDTTGGDGAAAVEGSPTTVVDTAATGEAEGTNTTTTGTEAADAADRRSPTDRRGASGKPASDTYVGPERRAGVDRRAGVTDSVPTAGMTLSAPTSRGAIQARGTGETQSVAQAPDVNWSEVLEGEHSQHVKAFLGINDLRPVSTRIQPGTVVAASKNGTGGIQSFRDVDFARLYPDVEPDQALTTVVTINAIAQIRADADLGLGQNWLPGLTADGEPKSQEDINRDMQLLTERAAFIRDNPNARSASGEPMRILLPGRVQASAFAHFMHGERMPDEKMEQVADYVAHEFTDARREVIDRAVAENPDLLDNLTNMFSAGVDKVKSTAVGFESRRQARQVLRQLEQSILATFRQPDNDPRQTRFEELKSDNATFLASPAPSRATRAEVRPREATAREATPRETTPQLGPTIEAARALEASRAGTDAAGADALSVGTPGITVSLAGPVLDTTSSPLTSSVFDTTPTVTVDGFNMTAFRPEVDITSDTLLLGGDAFNVAEDPLALGAFNLPSVFDLDSTHTNTTTAGDFSLRLDTGLSLTDDPLGIWSGTDAGGANDVNLNILGPLSLTSATASDTPSFVSMPNQPYDNWGLGPGPWNQQTLNAAKAQWERRTFGTTLSNPSDPFGLGTSSLFGQSRQTYGPLRSSVLDYPGSSTSLLLDPPYLTPPSLLMDPLRQFDPLWGLNYSPAPAVEPLSGYQNSSIGGLFAANQMLNLDGIGACGMSDMFRDGVTAATTVSASEELDIIANLESGKSYQPLLYTPLAQSDYKYTEVDSGAGFLDGVVSADTDGDVASRAVRRSNSSQSPLGQQREAAETVRARSVARAEVESQETNRFVTNVANDRLASQQRDQKNAMSVAEGGPRKDRGPRGLG